MLSRSSVEIGGQIADALLSRGVTIGARPSTPLGILNGALHSVNVDAEGPEVGDELIKASTPLEHFRFDQHGGELENIAKFISPKLAGSISFARNEVSELWKKTVAECTKAQAEAMSKKTFDFVITPIVESDIFDDYAFESIIKDYTTWAGKPRERLDTKLEAKISDSLNKETFMKVISTGIASVDAKLATIVENAEKLGEWNMQSAWYGLEDYTNQPFGVQILRNRDIISFMFMRGIVAGKLREVIGDIDSHNKMIASKYMRFYGEHVSRRLETIELIRERKEFALGGETSNSKRLYVYRPSYLKWINEGGSSEAVIGAVLEHGNMAGANMAVDAVAKYEGVYKRKAYVNRNLTTAKANSIVDRTIKSCIIDYIEEEFEGDEQKKAEYHQRLADKLYKMEYNSVRDLSEHVMVIVCLVIAKDTNALDQMQGMEEYLANNPEASVQEAAVHAATKIIADWLANIIDVTGQTKISNNNGRSTLVKL